MDPGSANNVITLTPDAEELLSSLLEREGLDPSAAGLRVAVERGGCAGLSYQFDLTESPNADDIVDERAGVSVFVDPAAVEYVTGASVDVVESAHGTGFRIENPNADQQCGCGLSFR